MRVPFIVRKMGEIVWVKEDDLGKNINYTKELRTKVVLKCG